MMPQQSKRLPILFMLYQSACTDSEVLQMIGGMDYFNDFSFLKDKPLNHSTAQPLRIGQQGSMGVSHLLMG